MNVIPRLVYFWACFWGRGKLVYSSGLSSGRMLALAWTLVFVGAATLSPPAARADSFKGRDAAMMGAGVVSLTLLGTMIWKIAIDDAKSDSSTELEPDDISNESTDPIPSSLFRHCSNCDVETALRRESQLLFYKSWIAADRIQP